MLSYGPTLLITFTPPPTHTHWWSHTIRYPFNSRILHLLTSCSPSSEERAAFDQVAKDQKAEQESRGPDRHSKFRPDIEILARQARELKNGKEAWKPGWVDYGEASGTRSVEDR